MKNKKGIAPVILLIVILVGAVAGYIVYVLFYSNFDMQTNLADDATSNPPSVEEPVSDDTDLDTIEAELEATITGSPSEELELMEKEASEL